jgi:thiosulfate dehydrogenase (quinone) large subunit
MATQVSNFPVSDSKLEAQVFGRSITFEYSPNLIVYGLVALRVAMGWILFQGGITKVLDPTWSAAGFLTHAIPEGNPLTGLWASLATLPAIDFLVAWGLTLTGIGIIVGGLLRWNAFWGAFMMLMFWAASLSGGVSQFLPLEHGWVVDDHIVYAFLLFALGAIGAGRVFGADNILEKSEFVQKNSWLKVFLG